MVGAVQPWRAPSLPAWAAFLAVAGDLASRRVPALGGWGETCLGAVEARAAHAATLAALQEAQAPSSAAQEVEEVAAEQLLRTLLVAGGGWASFLLQLGRACLRRRQVVEVRRPVRSRFG
eukprot:9509109-Lingulodinium_polyedra.AAC.1